MPYVSWILPARWSRLPAITSSWSSVSLPHCSFALPLNCFQLPSMRSQFMCSSLGELTANRLLDANVVADGGHALDVAGDLDRLVHLRAGTHEAAELHHALEGFDVDFGRLHVAVLGKGRLDLRRDPAVGDVLTGTLLRRTARATHG